uniref:DNA polymerase III, chi subunit n=1 Tax=Candidatus Kentrum sp. TUN TaxID=2126343 RepID=A0A450ZX84_9GAMM|nr:MAG: DNA polymerase III, chi subunit [Candidatus Kentron sp. TUN]VFK58373.1 MAG: DNA polymerase III, chi subunit [Candidatus Kentron sp. TUN]VFK65994.1 MAG: DNA polymerase III, chi subunit [Candidatus Kentron sp. TUN]
MHTVEEEPTVEGHDKSPRVDFYVLNTSVSDVPRMACRITEKAWKSGHRVFVHTGTRFSAHQMDNLLWGFRQESFVPHTIDSGHAENDTDNNEYPVLIGNGAEPRGELDVVINLGDAVPSFLARCQRIIEVVSGDAQDRGLARERYRLYRDQGCDLHTHDL